MGQIAGKLSLEGRGYRRSSKLLDNGSKEVLLIAKVAKEGDLVHASRCRQRAGSGPGIALFGKDLGSGPEDALAGVVHRGYGVRCWALIIDWLRHLALLRNASKHLHALYQICGELSSACMKAVDMAADPCYNGSISIFGITIIKEI
jgi:hypothetical protein